MTAQHSAQQLAARAADTIHELVRASGQNGYGEPADAYTTIGSLTVVVAGLPHLLHHTARWLHAQHAAGQLHADDGDTCQVIAAATGHLHDGEHAAEHLALILDAAQQHLAGLAAAGSHD